MTQKIKVGAVSYLNTKPLIYGFQQGMMRNEIELIEDYPSKIAQKLLDNTIDIGLVPVAILPLMKNYYLVSNYCIASNGEVASVCLFSDVPLNEIKEIILDYQSRTSVELLKILLNNYWKVYPKFIFSEAAFEEKIKNETAGLVIGDRALVQRHKSKHIYDLGLAWQEMTHLPFVFATWVSNKKLDAAFIKKFNDTNSIGFKHLSAICDNTLFSAYNLETYYTQNIKYNFGNAEQQGLNLFLNYLNPNTK